MANSSPTAFSIGALRARRGATALALVALLLAACTASLPQGSGDGGARTPLAGTVWTLQALGAHAALRAPSVTLHFGRDGMLAGSDGCNSYAGSYLADDGAIRIGGDIAATLMACPDPVEAQAGDYHEALRQALRFDIDGGALRLHSATGQVLASFVAAPLTPAGATWELTGYNNGRNAVVSVLAGTRISARFGSDGRLTGNGGCNSYSAPYEVKAALLHVGAASATRAFCAEPEGLMGQEQQYLEALASAASFLLDGERLELRSAGGSLVASFVRATAQ